MADALARRSVATGAGGAVAAGSRTAATIGASVMLAGGNAFDAAIAACMAETVAMPSKCGLAGDVVALFVQPGDVAPTSMVSIGAAATGLADAAAESDWQVGTTGALAVGVPGAPSGYAELAARGRLGLAALVAPAIELARRGVWWSPMNELLAAEARELVLGHQPQGTVYIPAGAPRRTGELVALPGLADALGEFAHRGPNLFEGPVGADIVTTVAAAGGVVTTEDLAAPAVQLLPAPQIRAGEHQLWHTPAPTYGPALAACLAGREPVDPAAVRAAIGELRGGVQPLVEVGEEGTSTVAAVDNEGAAVVVVHSLSFPQYGSGLVTGEYGLILSNRAGRGFTFTQGHPNAPAPGRRPQTTLHAWGIRDERDGWLLGATPGGRQQVGWNAQLIEAIWQSQRWQPETIGAALTAPRWQLAGDDGVDREGEGIAPLGARSSHTLAWSSDHRCVAAADPRWDGAAVAV